MLIIDTVSQYRKPPHPALPGMYVILICNTTPIITRPSTTTITHPVHLHVKKPPNPSDTYT